MPGLSQPDREGPARPRGRGLWLPLFLAFLKVGAFSFGGGFAAISLTYQEVVRRYRWLDEETFLAGTSLAQGAPGANATNTAVFVGYQLAGWWGAVVALLACSIPPVLAVLGLGLIFRYGRWPLLDRVFVGLRAGVLGLLAYLLLSWLWPLRRNPRGGLLFAVMLFALLGLKWHPMLVISVGALAGFAVGAGRGEKTESE